MTDREVSYKILSILQHYAPNDAAQAICANYYQDLQRNYSKPGEIARLMTNALADGLNYGNWPWKVNG